MKYFVTGAGGFLAGRLIRKLLSEGHEVWGLARSRNQQIEELSNLGLKSVRSDIREGNSLHQVFALASRTGGLHGVFHTAAKVGAWGTWKDFYATNVDGTRYMIDCCRDFAVPRLVFTSSPSVVLGGQDVCGGDESLPYASDSTSRYSQSKAMAEKMVLAAHGKDGLSTVALRPHLILGPGDRHLVPRLVEMQKKGRLAVVGDGKNRVDVIHVDNAVEAHLMAMRSLGPNSRHGGKAYFLGQERPVVLWDFINAILEAKGLPSVKRRVPATLAYTVGTLMEAWATITGKETDDVPMTRFAALQMSRSHYFNHQAFHRDVGNYLKFTLEDLLSSYHSQRPGNDWVPATSPDQPRADKNQPPPGL